MGLSFKGVDKETKRGRNNKFCFIISSPSFVIDSKAVINTIEHIVFVRAQREGELYVRKYDHVIYSSSVSNENRTII